MRPFFGQIQLQGGKRSREEAITRLSPDIDSVTVPKYYPDDPLFRKAISRHYGCIAYLDTEVEKIFNHLADEGLLENTVVFLFSDHGNDGLRAKQFCYEGGTHVPLIIVGPEKFGFRRGIRRNDLVSSLDISATTLALAGIKDNQVCDGQDLRDLSNQRSHVVSQRDRCDYTLDCIRSVVSDRFRYIENLCPDRPWLQAQYRSNWPEFKRWKELSRNDAEDSPALRFAREKRPKYELYDLKNDPDQVINLVDNPQYSDDLRRHREWLEKWCCAVNDPGAVFPESQLLSGLSRWGEEVCDHPLYKTVRERYHCSHGQHSELKPEFHGITLLNQN
jgi:arylsulfatase A-like enzyme